MIRYGSVCSGIEAASVAWHPLGWRPQFFSEIEAAPRAILKHHFPEVPLHGDFTTIREGEYGPIDLLVGGTPCQDFSVAGLRAGLDGQRGNLTLEYGRLAQRLRPRWVSWENVPGVLSSNGGRDFASVLGLLAGRIVSVPAGGWGNAGVVPGYRSAYGLAWRVLDAQYVRPAHCAVWDPACGQGHMIEVLLEHFGGGGWGSDIFDYGRGYRVEDFLDERTVIGSPGDGMAPEFIVTNPPFAPALSFALRALQLAPVVALLLRTQWLEGVERYESLFSKHPLTLYAPFVERVPMVKGRWDPKASTATAYAWFVWVRGMQPQPIFQIPPGCRERLTKASDYTRFAVAAETPLFANGGGEG